MGLSVLKAIIWSWNGSSSFFTAFANLKRRCIIFTSSLVFLWNCQKICYEVWYIEHKSLWSITDLRSAFGIFALCFEIAPWNIEYNFQPTFSYRLTVFACIRAVPGACNAYRLNSKKNNIKNSFAFWIKCICFEWILFFILWNISQTTVGRINVLSGNQKDMKKEFRKTHYKNFTIYLICCTLHLWQLCFFFKMREHNFQMLFLYDLVLKSSDKQIRVKISTSRYKMKYLFWSAVNKSPVLDIS